MTITLTLQLTLPQLSRLNKFLAEDSAGNQPFEFERDSAGVGDTHNDVVDMTKPSVQQPTQPETIALWSPEQQFRQLLNGPTEKLVRFVIGRGREFFNDELAVELGFENPAYTSSVLGKVTGKLRRVGVKAEGHRHTNWYTTHKVDGRTMLRVRPDVFDFFVRAFAERE